MDMYILFFTDDDTIRGCMGVFPTFENAKNAAQDSYNEYYKGYFEDVEFVVEHWIWEDFIGSTNLLLDK